MTDFEYLSFTFVALDSSLEPLNIMSEGHIFKGGYSGDHGAMRSFV